MESLELQAVKLSVVNHFRVIQVNMKHSVGTRVPVFEEGYKHTQKKNCAFSLIKIQQNCKTFFNKNLLCDISYVNVFEKIKEKNVTTSQ